MTTKRTKGFSSLDLALPVAPYYRTDPQVLKDVETMRANAASRWVKDDYSRTISRFHTIDDNSSKMGVLVQPKVEILRANSPTLKRLLAARVKLEKYSNSISRTITTSRQSARSTSYPKNYEKQSSATSQPVHAPPQPPPAPPPPPPPPPPPVPAPRKQINPQSSLGDKPLDKITYEKTWSLTGNMTRKCSLEIWLPKPTLDDDDENSSRTITPEIHPIEAKPQPIPTIKSRRPSVVKITATTTITNIETKSLDEANSKKPESVIMPRAYHYGDYFMDFPEERPRSSKSVTTVKSDSAGSVKSCRRQRTHLRTRRLSSSTHHSEEILRFGTIEVPTSAKTTSVKTKSTGSKHSNPSMISELMEKYSLIKKNHQELTQAKIQLEKPAHDSKNNTTKENSPRSRPPHIPESTSLVPSDHPTVSVKKLLIDTSPMRSITEHNNPNTKLLERRATPRKPSHSDIYPHLRIFSLANQRQHRQSSPSIPTALLPTVLGKKTDETTRILQRTKTLDVVLNVPNPVKVQPHIPTQPDKSRQLTINGTNEQTLSRITKRSALNLRSEPQNFGQHFHRPTTTTTIPTNTVLIHFNQGNTERHYIVPD